MHEKRLMRTTHSVVEKRILLLLILVVIAQFGYPITADGSLTTQILFTVMYLLLMVGGLLVASDHPLLTRSMVVLGVLYLIATLTYSFNPDVAWAILAAYFLIIVYQSMVTLLLLRYIFNARTVSRNIIYAASAVYLLLGAIFVPLFGLIESLTFLGSGGPCVGTHAFSAPGLDNCAYFPWQTFIYYSYTTLTTMGYGDVLPVTMLARSAATLEAVIGVLYVTIIMGRLIGLFATGEVERDLEDHTFALRSTDRSVPTDSDGRR